ncbi:gene transfer agent family protein [Rubrimonas cliftonensis]|uniref:Phage tail tube protein, GTA-gp10 n=1 Tax=Rubrimonas cliftonensis TaxID=89524 RepID=A0A1H3ZGU0_9RHOB|nr:gene transfer agent family protein [Rubrimonas cliftonensis]SEA22999.1 Phage tail tube protein, GTA-gp10 [Rubrimonas cliftonensis]
MANPIRGEASVSVDGRARTLRLTLGALAELEAGLGAEGLVDLVDRLERGGMRARDAIAVLTAGLRGAGEPVNAEDVASMRFDGGPAAAARAALALLAATFSEAHA